mmetsp:Transcript_79328/g.256894  ORF Transcript_79328/g.256894 Transcript_79328/m.256894 type:complete len:205 (-) Transcript_79328:2050-2664(-)
MRAACSVSRSMAARCSALRVASWAPSSRVSFPGRRPRSRSQACARPLLRSSAPTTWRRPGHGWWRAARQARASSEPSSWACSAPGVRQPWTCSNSSTWSLRRWAATTCARHWQPTRSRPSRPSATGASHRSPAAMPRGRGRQWLRRQRSACSAVSRTAATPAARWRRASSGSATPTRPWPALPRRTRAIGLAGQCWSSQAVPRH